MASISMCLAAAWMIVGQPGGNGATRVAVVDLSAASSRYLRTADLEAQFEQRRVKFNEDRKAMQDKIQRLTQSLQEEFKPGTAEFEDRRKQLAMQEAELQWFSESEGQKIERGLAESLRMIYSDIQQAVREVAEKQQIDVVLAADRLPVEPAQSTTQVRQQIVLQKVVYWNPRVDITEEVVVQLNERYRAKQLTSPAGAAPPRLNDASGPVD